MSYALLHGPCLICKQIKVFNPVRCPSLRVNGVREPICGSCMKDVNEQREAMGLDPFPIHHDAYIACDERELGE